MAQAGFTPISLYYSTTALAVPSSGNLVAGELALNTVDEKLYFKNSAGTVKLLASNATSAPVVSFSAGTTGFTPSTATTGAITLAGTLATTNGGTGLTSFTSGGVVYASSSSALVTGSALTFNGTNFATTGNVTASGKLIKGSDAGADATGDDLVLTTAGYTGATFFAGANDASTLYFRSGASPSTQKGFIQYDNLNNLLVFGVAAVEQMRLTSTGLGIGTSSISYKLQVAGTSNTVGLGITGTAASGDNGIYYNLASAITGNYNIINASVSATTGVSTTFANSNSSSATAHSRLDISTTGAGGGDPKTTYTISGVLNWSVGVDNSDSDKFKISGSDSPGTSDYLTITTSGVVSDQNGNLRAVPQSGSSKTSSYTLATTDIGEYILLGASGAIVIPDATFSAGDVVSIFNNTGSTATITCSITTAYIAGTFTDKATMTLAAAGVATVLFITSTLCVVSGNVT